ncbi:hypothetical protein F5Y13DRAFT_188759 [Hypoxylon sp. FL1857]|nr:hypothetical protein F5Y13DRAFT_188759 [Hypoxylon sp. FL1857]
MYQLAKWIDAVDQNYGVDAQLLRERLGYYDDGTFSLTISPEKASEAPPQLGNFWPSLSSKEVQSKDLRYAFMMIPETPDKS